MSFVDRRNIEFLLFDVLRLDRLLAHPRFEQWDRASVKGVLDLVQQVAERELLPSAALLDAAEPRFVEGCVEMPPQVGAGLRACRDSGFFAATFDEAIGGMQLPATIGTVMNGILAAANISIANYQVLTTAAAGMLEAFGTAEQKATILPAMLAGRWFGTMCLSEPQAGSSLADVRTRADPIAGRRHRITGSKMWISGGEHELSDNIIHMVLARIPGAPPGVKGISLFVVPKYRIGQDGERGACNNISLAGLNHKMGQRGTTNCLLNFGEEAETWGDLVGEPHQGLAYMFHMMNEARVAMGMNAVMLGTAGYLYSLDYAATRPQGRLAGDKDPLSPPVPIIAHADVKRMLLFQKAATEGGLALVCYCATLVDQLTVEPDQEVRADLELLLGLLTPIAKSWPSEHCLEANKLAIQVLGGYGYTREYPVERLYRDNRLNHIHEGTFGIQGLDLLGRKVRLQGGRALHLLAGRIEQTLDDAGETFATERSALEAALVSLRSATDATAACPDIEAGLANATLYLDAFGHVVVAWLWLEQALAATLALATDGARSFHEGKIAACTFFFRYELPKARLALDLVASLDTTALRMQPEQFSGL